MEYKDYPDEQLVGGAGTGAGVQWMPIEMMRRLKDSIENLDKSVNAFSNTTSKQQNVMTELARESGKQAEAMLKSTNRIYWLTWVIAFLTVVMVIKMFWK